MRIKSIGLLSLTVLAGVLIGGCASPIGSVRFPQPSADFTPKETYTVGFDKLWDGTLAALENNRIANTSVDKASGIIQTDYIQGAGQAYAGGFVATASTRYKYNLTLRSQGDNTVKLNIICKIESTMTGRAGSSPWEDITGSNPQLAEALEKWLYEEIEKGLGTEDSP